MLCLIIDMGFSEMKSNFKGYYDLTDSEFKLLWDNCIFVLDTNILLNFYRYTEKTNSDFFSILEKIKNRLWIPYQVALEYQKNRLTVISEKKEAYKELEKIIDDISKNYKASIQGKGFERHPIIEINAIGDKIDETCSSIKKQIKEKEKNHPDLIKSDKIREQLDRLLEGKIGQSFTIERLKEIYKEGEKRYDEKIPPGFADNDKKGNSKFGDLVIWFEILEKGKTENKSIIFVVDDGKEDWWNKIKGKTLGPRPELIQEFYSMVNADFYMYKSERFMSYAEKHLGLKFDSNSVKEVERVSKDKRSVSSFSNLIGYSPALEYSIDSIAPLLAASYSLDPEYVELSKKQGEIERMIIESQLKLLELREKQATEDILFSFQTSNEISRLEEKVKRLKEILGDIEKIVPKTYRYSR
jgi:hypothetical protein